MDLVQCLLATLSPDTQIRQHATSCLDEWSKQEGFCLKLIAVVQSNDPAAAAVRQLAGVVLRRHIQRHWASEDLENGAAQVSEAEKAQVRAILPSSLAEPNSLIQTAVGMAIAEIGKSDCPHAWPELLPGLVGAVSDKTNAYIVSGAVRCLALLVEDIGDEQVVEIAPIVLPELLHIVQSEAHPPSLRRWSLIIFKTCLGALELTYKQSPAAATVLQAALGPWLQAIAAILDAPLSGDDATLWGIKFEALGCLVRIVRAFSKLAAPFLPPVLSSCWSMFTNCAPLYDQLVVRGEGDDSGIEEESSLERVSFSELISQLFELLLTLLSNSRVLPMLRPAFQQLAYLCVGYMQASDENMEKWNADVNEYLSNEDDFWSTRASGELLLDELLESGGADGMAAVGDAIQRRASEATAAKQAGDEYWWKLKEAALLATGAVAERCVELKRKKKTMPAAIDPEIAATAVLSEVLTSGEGGTSPPFVVGRALWLFYKWAPALSPGLRSAALRVACPALAPGNPAFVQAGACQAVARLCKKATPEDIQSVSEQAFVGLASLLPSTEEDSLHLVVGTLTSLVKVDPAGAARWALHLIPGALKVWVDNVADPLLGEDAEDLLRAVAAAPGCLPALQNSAVPTLCEVVSNPGAHSPILVSGCLDMLTLVLQPSTPEAAAAVAGVALPPVLRVLSTTDDEDVASSAVAFLRTTLQVGGPAAFVWTGQDPAVGAAAMIQAAQHLLRPETPDIACRNVGGLILELLRHAAAQITPQLGDILVAIARKLRTVEDPMAVQSLLSVLAFVARSDAAQLVDLLSKADGGAGDGTSALHVAMSKWTERHMEIRTPYDIKASITALGSLLACPHPALNAVVVRGKRIDTSTGIRTRARGVTQAEQWSQVPLRVKLVMLLADSYIEASTQGDGEHGMGQWAGEEEEYDFDDDEDEDDDDYDDDGDDENRSNAGQWDEYGMLMSAFDDEDGNFFESELANVDPLENARRLADPLSSMDVGAYVAGAFKELAQSSQELMQAAAAELTPTQVEAVQQKDLSLLSRAAALSLTSSGETQPHPNAACILTDPSGTVIAEAYLLAQGTQAPEIAATLAAQGRAEGGTAYLNLETGDCHGDTSAIKALISSGVRRVVIGLRHPVAALRGVAIDALHAVGIIVSVLSESPCSASPELIEATDTAVLLANESLLHVTALNRPLGVLKYAMTLDGKIAASSGHSAWVSGTDSRQKVFETRAMSDAVIVGGQTVRRDDPRLTTRREGGHQPLRIVMSRTLDLPVGAALWDTTQAPTIVATQRGVRKEFQRMLRSRGVEVLEFDFLSPAVLADYCRQRGFLRLLWECGGTLAAPAIAGGAVHKVMAFVAPKIIGGTKAPTPVGDLGFVEMTQALALHEVQWSLTGQDLMLSGYLPISRGARALAAALGLRKPVEEHSVAVAAGGGAEAKTTASASNATVNGRSSGPSHRLSSNIESPTSSSHISVAGFYKNWERFGCFSNFSPHAITMPDVPMTHLNLETFHPRPGMTNANTATNSTGTKEWKTSEHYYQAQKFAGVNHPEAIALIEKIFAAPSPEVAAAIGRRNERLHPELLREDWGQSKSAAMHAALRAKFAAHEGPRQLLLSPVVRKATIVETAPHDYFWGQGFDGSGHNMLGKLLMKVRDEFLAELQEEEESQSQTASGKKNSGSSAAVI